MADGRLDSGIVREDAVPKERKRWRLGSVGYALFAANALWNHQPEAPDLLRNQPVADLLPGGQFPTRWREWLAMEEIQPRILGRLSTFTDASRVVQAGHAAAALPEIAAVDFDPKKFKHGRIDGLNPRTLTLIANARSLDRSGIASGAEARLCDALRVGSRTGERRFGRTRFFPQQFLQLKWHLPVF